MSGNKLDEKVSMIEDVGAENTSLSPLPTSVFDVVANTLNTVGLELT